MPVIVLVSEVEKETVDVPQLQFFDRGRCARCNVWFDSGYIFFISLWMALEEFGRIHIFLRGLVDSDPEVVASLTHVTTVVFHNGSGMHSTGFSGFPAPCAAYPTITGRKWPRSSSFSTVACSGGDWLRLLVTMHFALCSFACRPFWVEEGVAALRRRFWQ